MGTTTESFIVLDDTMSFAEIAAESKEKFWKLDDVFPEMTTLDFSCPLLPESLTRVTDDPFLTPSEALRLNQITGKSYINLFYFVEEYIIRDVERMARDADEPSGEKKALHRFAAEEVKHQALFRRFMAAFDRGFESPPEVLDFADDVADLIMGNSRLAVLLTTFHLEIITQEHYLSSIEPSEGVEPHMVSILRHHWQDEARHAAIDYLEIRRLCSGLSAAERTSGFDEYLSILEAIFGLLSMQASHDIASLEEARKGKLPSADHLRLQHLQHRGYSRIFLELGVCHPALRQLLDDVLPGKENQLDVAADKFRLT